jgi:hypothetical protein
MRHFMGWGKKEESDLTYSGIISEAVKLLNGFILVCEF